MLFPTSHIATTTLSGDLFDQKQVRLHILRLDRLHEVVSGNKLFKLHYFLCDALQQHAPGMITFGGPYSNHLVATACACKEAGLKSVAIVRGEEPAVRSPTLQACSAFGMELIFIARSLYDKKEEADFVRLIAPQYQEYLVVPEGGYHRSGAEGAALIMKFINHEVSHTCCAVGTATTASGLLLAQQEQQQVVAVPVLKNMHDLQQRILNLTNQHFKPGQLAILDGYHFGGYAKKSAELINFMNALYLTHEVPTDFVYTGKLMFGIFDCIKNDYFLPGSSIMCIHTGGLQGNLSLPPGTLVF